jgi:transcriptional regulator with XRE-family HTH domain
MKDLKTYRELKGITQQQLADATGLHIQTVFKLENARVMPDPLTRKAIENYFGLRINWLSTLSTNEGEQKSWEDCESDLRSVLCNAKRLAPKERKEFLNVVKDYASTLEAICDLEAADDPDGPLYVPEVYYALKERAKGG